LGGCWCCWCWEEDPSGLGLLLLLLVDDDDDGKSFLAIQWAILATEIEANKVKRPKAGEERVGSDIVIKIKVVIKF
jgi:hypothetical protein